MDKCAQCNQRIDAHNVTRKNGRLQAFCFSGSPSLTWAPADIDRHLSLTASGITRTLPREH